VSPNVTLGNFKLIIDQYINRNSYQPSITEKDCQLRFAFVQLEIGDVTFMELLIWTFDSIDQLRLTKTEFLPNP
jgi:hypothetical protein